MDLWETEKYYNLAKLGSSDKNHLGMKLLKIYSNNASKILDLGCGEGTRLAYIAGNKEGFGVDISNKAISLANKSYPTLKFEKMNLEKLAFNGGEFDLVYSAFVLEHLKKPEKVLSEAIRVLKHGGHLILIAPNFGSPNRSSPVFKGSRIRKFLTGFLSDYLLPFRAMSKLKWKRVDPIDDIGKYTPDSDATIEPYLGSLIYFLKDKGMKIEKFSSCWEEELSSAKMEQKIFRLLGELRLYPFRMWGPHLVVVAQKE